MLLKKADKYLIIFLLAGFFLFSSGIFASGEIISSVPVSPPIVALTFDDGPSPETTPSLLQTLSEFGAKATFFVVGENALLYPEILRQIAGSGNEIGNHTLSHQRLPDISEKITIQQIFKTQVIISEITGLWPKLMRPPYSAISKRVEAMAKSLNVKIIMWSVSPADYENPSPEIIAERVLSAIKPGDIVVMHDYCPNTTIALPKILKGLKEKNLRAVTISELLKR